MKKQVKNFQQHAQQQFSQQQEYQANSSKTEQRPSASSSKKGDYIDFEEIRD
jgi:hypothetical protein